MTGNEANPRGQYGPRGRFHNSRLRRASFISPTTGERSRRDFTLLEASHRRSDVDDNDDATETTGLLGHDKLKDKSSYGRMLLRGTHSRIRQGYDFATSKTGKGIFKCSLAYLLGSLVTFVPAFAGLIGRQQDSKHMVATVTVWFHPARSMGNMHLATALGLLGFLYSNVVGFTSMGVSLGARHADMLTASHVLVLLVFVGGGLGFIAWVKQRFSGPLVNTATALASLGCIVVIIREGSVQEGYFSVRQVAQIMEMLLMGIFVATVINVLIFPATARTQLQSDMEDNTDLLGELLICITRAFLSGRESDLQDEFFESLQKEHQQALQKMHQDLSEAKYEYFLLGREKLYDVASELVECLDRLSQDLGGLRSAALAEFALVSSTSRPSTPDAQTPQKSTQSQPISFADLVKNHKDSLLNSVTEHEESNTTPPNEEAHSTMHTAGLANLSRTVSAASAANLESPEDMFFAFIRQLGPHTKSLVYTLKQILDELPFKRKAVGFSSAFEIWVGHSEVEVVNSARFRSSLKEALDLYRTSRKEALNELYTSRALSAAYMPSGVRKAVGAFGAARTKTSKAFGQENGHQARKPSLPDRPPEELLADIEEVSACCGHFSFSLLDLSEDVVAYLDLLDNLKEVNRHSSRSWRWLLFWNSCQREEKKRFHIGGDSEEGEEHSRDHHVPEPMPQAKDYTSSEKAHTQNTSTFRKSLYQNLGLFRRDDVKFAIKVGVGAILYSLPAFLPETRPFFTKWRGEWGLVSYMAVVCMTIGAANTTGMNRFAGTAIGAALAVIAWLLSASHDDANPYLLAFFGWLVANGAFYLILAKNQGPMGRFILLTYNLAALYAYSLSIGDDDNDEDEGGIDPAIWDIVLHRLVAVIVGSLWALVICRCIWPNSARRKLKDGLCILWLRMSLVWKRDPLAMFLSAEPTGSNRYMDIREEAELHSFLTCLDSMRAAAAGEFELRGPFPDAVVGRIVERTRRMLDAFHALNVVIAKDLNCTAGEAAVLKYTREQRYALSSRLSHLFSVLASSYKLEFPLSEALPSIENSRDALLARISEFRRTGEGRETATESDYELLYCYVLVTGQLALDIGSVAGEIEMLFGSRDEENLKIS